MLSAKQEPTVRTRAERGNWPVAGAIVSSVLNIKAKIAPNPFPARRLP